MESNTVVESFAEMQKKREVVQIEKGSNPSPRSLPLSQVRHWKAHSVEGRSGGSILFWFRTGPGCATQLSVKPLLNFHSSPCFLLRCQDQTVVRLFLGRLSALLALMQEGGRALEVRLGGAVEHSPGLWLSISGALQNSLPQLKVLPPALGLTGVLRQSPRFTEGIVMLGCSFQA